MLKFYFLWRILHLMEMKDRITVIEKRISDLGMTVAHVCRKAGIDRSTWARWKDGSRKGANLVTWESVQKVIEDAEKEISI